MHTPHSICSLHSRSAETDTATTSSSKQEVFVSSREETWRDFSDTDLALVVCTFVFICVCVYVYVCVHVCV